MEASSLLPKHEDSGWPAVERYMKKHDEAMMKEYNEDIDTLLVLDGLFSAVVTGFVIPAYGLLQPDNTQVAADLLGDISVQLRSFTFHPPFVNTTFPVPSASATAFTVSNASRWINVLWFLSLVLSLASAVLGILVKQWIREYLKWDNTTSLPKENVIVRQLRYDAWMDWYTSSIISTIPVLLELAIVLFFAGLVIFTWTLDVGLAIPITIAVALFVLVFLVLVALPAGYKRCPYKSPTAWAVTRGVETFKACLQLPCDLLSSALRMLLSLLNPGISATAGNQGSISLPSCLATHFGTFSSRANGSRDWRTRDQEIPLISPFLPPSLTLSISDVRKEIETEINSTPLSSQEKNPLLDELTSTDDEDLRNRWNTFSLLFKALQWTSDASQDYSLNQEIVKCAESTIGVHIAFASPSRTADAALKTSMLRIGIRLVALWEYFSHTLRSSGALEQLRKTDRSIMVTASSRVSLTQDFLRKFYTPGRPRILASTLLRRDVRTVYAFSASQRRVFGHLLASLVKHSVTVILDFLSNDHGSIEEIVNNDRNWHLFAVFKQRHDDMICALRLFVFADAKEPSITRIDYAPIDCLNIICDAYNLIVRHSSRSVFDDIFPGVRDSLVLATPIWEWEKGTHILKFGGPFFLSQHGRSALLSLIETYPGSLLRNSREDHRIFCGLVTDALRYLAVPGRLNDDILRQMTVAINYAKEKGWTDGLMDEYNDWRKLVAFEPDVSNLSSAMESSYRYPELANAPSWYHNVPDSRVRMQLGIQGSGPGYRFGTSRSPLATPAVRLISPTGLSRIVKYSYHDGQHAFTPSTSSISHVEEDGPNPRTFDTELPRFSSNASRIDPGPGRLPITAEMQGISRPHDSTSHQNQRPEGRWRVCSPIRIPDTSFGHGSGWQCSFPHEHERDANISPTELAPVADHASLHRSPEGSQLDEPAASRDGCTTP